MPCSEARAEFFDCCLFADHNDREQQRMRGGKKKKRKGFQNSQRLLGVLVSIRVLLES